MHFRIGSHEHERSTTPQEYILAFICIYKSSMVIITLAILTNTLLLDIIHTATTFITIITIINVVLELIAKRWRGVEELSIVSKRQAMKMEGIPLMDEGH